MRFDKRSRKIRVGKVKKRSSRFPSFLLYSFVGAVLLAFFYLILYKGHQRQMDRFRSEKIREDMDKICSALALFHQDHGRNPAAEEGLEGLVRSRRTPAEAVPESEGKEYLDRLPVDPWGSPYVYEFLPGSGSFTVTCWGADRRPGGTGEASDTAREGCKGASVP